MMTTMLDGKHYLTQVSQELRPIVDAIGHWKQTCVRGRLFVASGSYLTMLRMIESGLVPDVSVRSRGDQSTPREPHSAISRRLSCWGMLIPSVHKAEENVMLGIAVVTYNRAEVLRNTIESIRGYTSEPFVLVVADDGSTDSTKMLLSDMRVPHISGPNKGIAWNKNRGIFYLVEVEKCSEIIMLEDDTYPVRTG
jgi:hypothetical protein